jgi:hypothetical protein
MNLAAHAQHFSVWAIDCGRRRRVPGDAVLQEQHRLRVIAGVR